MGGRHADAKPWVGNGFSQGAFESLLVRYLRRVTVATAVITVNAISPWVDRLPRIEHAAASFVKSSNQKLARARLTPCALLGTPEDVGNVGDACCSGKPVGCGQVLVPLRGASLMNPDVRPKYS